jgi:DNA-binding XRE family transcriptional regulator
MANLANVLKDEIARLASKEVRKQLDDSGKTQSEQAKQIKSLQKQVDQLEKQVQSGGGAKRGRPRSKAASSSASTGDGDSQVRFSPKWLRSHREKLGLSAADYAKLVGVSQLSIYKWEKGETTPRAAQREKLASIRGMGKREAQNRLEELKD